MKNILVYEASRTAPLPLITVIYLNVDLLQQLTTLSLAQVPTRHRDLFRVTSERYPAISLQALNITAKYLVITGFNGILTYALND